MPKLTGNPFKIKKGMLVKPSPDRHRSNDHNLKDLKLLKVESLKKDTWGPKIYAECKIIEHANPRPYRSSSITLFADALVPAINEGDYEIF